MNRTTNINLFMYLYDMQVWLEVGVRPIKFHQVSRVRPFFVQIERDKLDLLGRFAAVRKGRGQLVQIVHSDGDKGPLSTNVVVQFFLEVDQALVRGRSYGDIPKDGGDQVGPDGLGRGGNDRGDLYLWGQFSVTGRFDPMYIVSGDIT